MPKYKENQSVLLLAPVPVTGGRMAVVTQIRTPPMRRAETPDARMEYTVRTAGALAVDVVGADIERAAAEQPLPTNADNFMTKLREALEEGQDRRLILPDRITARGRTVAIYTPAETICAFRGDDRGSEEIYRDGFRARSDVIAPEFKSNQGDVDAYSGTCASLLPPFGALFPLQAGGERPAVDGTYLYLLAGAPYMTCRVQEAILSYRVPVVGYRSTEERLRLNEAAREVIFPDTLAGTRVLGYFQVDRTWLGDNYWDGMDFTILPQWHPNPAAVCPNHEALLAGALDGIAPYLDKRFQLQVVQPEPEHPQRAWQLTRLYD